MMSVVIVSDCQLAQRTSWKNWNSGVTRKTDWKIFHTPTDDSVLNNLVIVGQSYLHLDRDQALDILLIKPELLVVLDELEPGVMVLTSCHFINLVNHHNCGIRFNVNSTNSNSNISQTDPHYQSSCPDEFLQTASSRDDGI